MKGTVRALPRILSVRLLDEFRHAEALGEAKADGLVGPKDEPDERLDRGEVPMARNPPNGSLQVRARFLVEGLEALEEPLVEDGLVVRRAPDDLGGDRNVLVGLRSL